uniref:VPS9 domain-containing protein n=1 Tax=Palpitomonas bilix TaxID=652834 RepID=A0A7S3DHG3_9EUKA|mmetsp:Transcript_37116/g.96268  ORF Transcript_37116/g.96268 Transcript_37116/m.96268 type:complete len:541 (+) Transcript_37116:80-1702(+)
MKVSNSKDDPLTHSGGWSRRRTISVDEVFSSDESSKSDRGVERRKSSESDRGVEDANQESRDGIGGRRRRSSRLILLPSQTNPLGSDEGLPPGDNTPDKETRSASSLERRRSQVDFLISSLSKAHVEGKTPLFSFDEGEETGIDLERRNSELEDGVLNDNKSLKGIASRAFFGKLRSGRGTLIEVRIAAFLRSFGVEGGVVEDRMVKSGGKKPVVRPKHERSISYDARTFPRVNAERGSRAMERQHSVATLARSSGKDQSTSTSNGGRKGEVHIVAPTRSLSAVVDDEKIRLAADRVQDFMSDTEEMMVASGLWRDEPAWVLNAAFESLEAFVTSSIYDIVFGRSKDDVAKDGELRERVAKLQFIQPEHLDIPKQHQNEFSFSVAEAEIRKINIQKSPREKLIAICQCCRSINSMLRLSSPAEVPGADDLLPILVLLILKAKPAKLFSDLNYIHRFRHSSRLNAVSESVCYLTHFYAAASFIITLEASQLNIDVEAYDLAVRSAERRIGGSISHLPLPSPVGGGEDELKPDADEEGWEEI